MVLAAWPWQWSASAWSALTFVMLVVAAGLTWRQVVLAQRVRQDQARPFVLIDFNAFQTIIEIHITNIGTTLATDVQFEFDPPLISARDDQREAVAELNIFKTGIPSIAPGKKITVLFDQFPTRIERGLPLTYRATVTYRDARGKEKYEEDTVLDLAFLVGTGSITRYGLHEIHKELKNIADTIKRWSDSDGLKVLTRADLIQKREELERYYEEQEAAEAKRVAEAAHPDSPALPEPQ